MLGFEMLYRQVRHGSDDEQATAAQALGERGDLRAVPALLQLLDTTESDAVRNVAALALRDLADPRAVPALIHHIAKPRNPANIGTLLYALAAFDACAALIPLAQVMVEGSYEVLAMGLQVIGALKGLPPERDVARALDILQMHLTRRDYEDWQREMLEALVEQLLELRSRR